MRISSFILNPPSWHLGDQQVSIAIFNFISGKLIGKQIIWGLTHDHS